MGGLNVKIGFCLLCNNILPVHHAWSPSQSYSYDFNPTTTDWSSPFAPSSYGTVFSFSPTRVLHVQFYISFSGVLSFAFFPWKITKSHSPARLNRVCWWKNPSPTICPIPTAARLQFDPSAWLHFPKRLPSDITAYISTTLSFSGRATCCPCPCPWANPKSIVWNQWWGGGVEKFRGEIR